MKKTKKGQQVVVNGCINYWREKGGFVANKKGDVIDRWTKIKSTKIRKKWSAKDMWDCPVCGTKNSPKHEDCWWCIENKRKIEKIVTQAQQEALQCVIDETEKLEGNKEFGMSPKNKEAVEFAVFAYNQAIGDIGHIVRQKMEKL